MSPSALQPSPPDITTLVNLCNSLYRRCRSFDGEEYREVSHEVRSLHKVLRHLSYEIDAPDSSLNAHNSVWERKLTPITTSCDLTLRELDDLISKHAGSPQAATGRFWDEHDMDQLGQIRVKLISHKKALTTFLDELQLQQDGDSGVAMPDNRDGHLDMILDKVDNIAEKMARDGGIGFQDDGKEVWKVFKRELVAEGFSSEVLQEHKDVLRAYIREIDQKGLLNDSPTEPELPPRPIATDEGRFLDSARSLPAGPPSFESLKIIDDGTKEMVARDENMKFPQSIKFERPKPESRQDGWKTHLEVPYPEMKERSVDSGSLQRPPLPPRILTSSPSNSHHGYSSDSSESELDSSGSLALSSNHSNALVIRTTDLLALTQAPQPLLLPSSLPSSFRSQGSYVEDLSVPRTMAQSPKRIEFSSSPSHSNAIPIPVPSSNQTSLYPERISGTSPQPPQAQFLRLAPDSHGNEIGPDAKWTKINRQLVSPEVLHQDGRRYEARPDFVAVLGVLSHSEIESYAARTHSLREARRHHHPNHHHLSNSHSPQPQLQDLSKSPNSTNSRILQEIYEQPPPHPPRPLKSILKKTNQRPVSSSSDHNHSQSFDDSDFDSDHEKRKHHRSRHARSHSRKERSKDEHAHSDYNYTHQPNNGYAPPSPSRGVSPGVWMPQPPPGVQAGAGGGIWIPAPNPSLHSSGSFPRDKGHERDQGKYRERDTDKLKKKHTSRDRERDRERDRPRSRWRENLAAAGIGGAAASLINVLSEAAEAL